MRLTQALERAVQQGPDLPATIFGGRTRTWAQCHDRVTRFAGALRGLGVGAGDRVGILALNRDDYHEFQLAVPWSGGVGVPVNTRWSVEEIAFSLADSGTRVLVVDDAFAGLVPAILERGPGGGDGDPLRRGDHPRGRPGLRGPDRRARPGARRGPRRRRPRRDLLHRRHHRAPQGRHAQPRQPARLRPRQLRERALPRPRRAAAAHRADVPPGRRRRLGGPQPRRRART